VYVRVNPTTGPSYWTQASPERMEALVKMIGTLNQRVEAFQEELDSTVSRAWCTYMYYNGILKREKSNQYSCKLLAMALHRINLHILVNRSTNSFSSC
jgi:hypothetical protein